MTTPRNIRHHLFVELAPPCLLFQLPQLLHGLGIGIFVNTGLPY